MKISISISRAVLPDNSKAIFQLYIFPLVSWIWIGYWVLLFGTIICLIPGKVRLQYARTEVVGIATARLQRWNLKLLIAFFAAVAALFAQDPTSYLTPDVARVGAKLACRCGGCRNTVGNCPMLHCGSADPIRRRIHEMQARGMSDRDVVNTIVREQGIVACHRPPLKGSP